MTIYKWGNADKTSVVKIEDDLTMGIPVSMGNRHYREFLTLGIEPEPWKTQDELDAMAALEARVTELEAEREAANIRDITPQQAKNYIDAQFAAASTNAEVVTAIKRILKKMVVFLLR